MIREQIEAKLRAAFDPMYLEVVDESYRHNVPAGSESHFKVVLVSDRFHWRAFPQSPPYDLRHANRGAVEYGACPALHTYTIKEWEALQDTVFASPPCRGAGSIA